MNMAIENTPLKKKASNLVTCDSDSAKTQVDWTWSNVNVRAGDIEILGWCPAGSVLPHGGKVPL